MSLTAMRWTLERLADPDCDLSLGARAAALVLADCAGPDGTTWAGRAHVGKVLGLSERQTARVLAELRRWAHLPVVDRRGRSPVWHFPAGVGSSTPVSDTTPPRLSTPVSDMTGGGVRSDTPRVSDLTPDPTNEPTIEKSAAAAADVYPDPRDVRSIIRMHRDAELARMLDADDRRRAATTEDRDAYLARVLAADDARRAAARQ